MGGLTLSIGNLYVEANGHNGYIRELRNILRIYNPKAKHSTQVEQYIHFLDPEGRFLRGLLPYVEEKLEANGIEYTKEFLHEETFEFQPCPPEILTIPGRDYQCMCVEQAFYYKRGVIQVATGGGKTWITCAMCKMVENHLDGETITFVNKTRLMHQTAARFKEYGLKDVGIVGDGIFDPRTHTVAMVQSVHKLIRKGQIEWLKNITLANFDETHHLGADSWSLIAKVIDAPYSIGYSGTPFREGVSNFTDPADVQLLGLTGGVIAEVSASYLIKRNLLAKPYIFMLPIDDTDQVCDNDRSWQQVEKAFISENGDRNNVIVRLSQELVSRGLNPLVLVNKIKHGHGLMLKMAEAGLRPIFLSGGPKKHTVQHGTVVEEIDETPDASVQQYLDGDYNVLVGSTIFDEGVDLPAVTAVINCSGGKSFIKNLQKVGRGLRPKKGTNEAYIFDFWDLGHGWIYKHSEERIADYKSEDEFVVFEDGYIASLEFFGVEQW